MLLKDKLKPYRLLLASQSPRRRELMTGCGLPYELAPKYECEEVYPAGMPGEEVPLYLSRLKSEAYPAALAPNEILLTADTVVVSDGEVLGKLSAAKRPCRCSAASRGAGTRWSRASRCVPPGGRTPSPPRAAYGSGRSRTRRSPITSTPAVPTTRPARTASRSGSATPPSKRSTARSTMSWGSRFRKYTPNSTNSSNK